MNKNIDVMMLLAKAVRIALKRPKQRVIALPDRVIEVTSPSKSGYNPQAIIRILSGLDLGGSIEDLEFKRTKLVLPFGQKAELLTVVMVVVTDADKGTTSTTIFNISCSPDFGAIEVSSVQS